MTPAAASDGLPDRQTLHEVWSPQRRNRRDVNVYLPSSYARSGRRYPVVYMQDGQNLSDPSTAFAGTWHLEAVLRSLADRRVEPIVVGVHNVGDERLDEYSPFPDRRHPGGEGDSYLRFLIETLKPRIDRLFRTRRQPRHTAIAGSSMGGLISLYAWFRRPDVFGLAAALSPSLWFGRDRLVEFIRSVPLPRGRLYLDVGTSEGAAVVRDLRLVRGLLEGRGMKLDEDLSYLEERGGRHDEAAWGRRIDHALEFLFRGTVSRNAGGRA